MCARKSFGISGVSKPLYQALRYEFPDRLCGVAVVVEVVECDAEESFAFGSAFRMGASEEVLICFKYRLAVGASVFFEWVCAVYVLAGGQPVDDVFDELPVLRRRLVMQKLVEGGPCD